MSEAALKVGSRWRNRRTGTTVVIEQVLNTSHNPAYPYYDIRYYTTTPNKESRRGACFEDYWHKNYELLGEQP